VRKTERRAALGGGGAPEQHFARGDVRKQVDAPVAQAHRDIYTPS